VKKIGLPTRGRTFKLGHTVVEGVVMASQVTQIPFPGDSGRTPTGAMQFQDDWPGLFIRGDSAVSVLFAIRRLQVHFRDCDDLEVASALSVLGSLADIIDQDVIVRHG
jgi:hypothetical protein